MRSPSRNSPEMIKWAALVCGRVAAGLGVWPRRRPMFQPNGVPATSQDEGQRRPSERIAVVHEVTPRPRKPPGARCRTLPPRNGNARLSEVGDRSRPPREQREIASFTSTSSRRSSRPPPLARATIARRPPRSLGTAAHLPGPQPSRVAAGRQGRCRAPPLARQASARAPGPPLARQAAVPRARRGSAKLTPAAAARSPAPRCSPPIARASSSGAISAAALTCSWSSVKTSSSAITDADLDNLTLGRTTHGPFPERLGSAECSKKLQEAVARVKGLGPRLRT